MKQTSAIIGLIALTVLLSIGTGCNQKRQSESETSVTYLTEFDKNVAVIEETLTAHITVGKIDSASIDHCRIRIVQVYDNNDRFTTAFHLADINLAAIEENEDIVRLDLPTSARAGAAMKNVYYTGSVATNTFNSDFVGFYVDGISRLRAFSNAFRSVIRACGGSSSATFAYSLGDRVQYDGHRNKSGWIGVVEDRRDGRYKVKVLEVVFNVFAISLDPTDCTGNQRLTNDDAGIARIWVPKSCVED